MNRQKQKTPNTWPVRWHARLIDPGDGSGDRIIELPDGLLQQLGWEIDDRLVVEINSTRELMVRKYSRHANGDRA